MRTENVASFRVSQSFGLDFVSSSSNFSFFTSTPKTLILPSTSHPICLLLRFSLPSSPPLLWERLDVFYVQPDPARGPGDPVWFSSTPLERQILESLLTRVLLARDIYTDKPLWEEEEDEEECGDGPGGE